MNSGEAKQTVVLNISSRGVVDVMREKEASGDPDMIDLKYFLMNEVVAGVLDPSYYLRPSCLDQTYCHLLARESGLSGCKNTNS